MEKKKIDSRIKTLIENCVAQKHRSFFVIVGGERAKYQVVNLHFMLSKATISARPNVLWCYKKDLGFESNAAARKRIKKIQHKRDHGIKNADDPFELFIGSTEIRYCYYSESEKILGSTFGMCVLQDFEAITPNVLARAIETVQGGGAVVLLLGSLEKLSDLYNLSMDVHAKYKSEKSGEVVCRFNERFVLSLQDCETCLVVDDELNILPVSAGKRIEPVLVQESSSFNQEKAHQQSSLPKIIDHNQETPSYKILSLAKQDQGEIIENFLSLISGASTTADESTIFKTTLSLTAARGRGKSAALGLCIAAALTVGKFSNIFVTSPAPENLQTCFAFVVKGLQAAGFEEHLDFNVIASASSSSTTTIRISIFKSHRQTVQWIAPQDANLLSQAELVVIDEAAAIPLPLVKAILASAQSSLVFLASTVSGYEGTGRSLSLKLIAQLKQTKGEAFVKSLTLNQPIRYAQGDPVERWLNRLLCLEVSSETKFDGKSTSCLEGGGKIRSGCPHPDACSLYWVNRDTLFSYHKASEVFLQRMVALYAASHYKNTPNDLQLMSDAPSHHLFVLLPPVDESSTCLPDILCAIQVALEGSISKAAIIKALDSGDTKGAGDLIPWTLSQQFQDENFASLSGARVVRISTHPEMQKMGYGTRAMQQLEEFLLSSAQSRSNDNSGIDLAATPSSSSTKRLPLLERLDEVEKGPFLGKLDWLGVSFGITPPLFKFWKRLGLAPVYIRQTCNELTGENSAIMIKNLQQQQQSSNASNWLAGFYQDFRTRFIRLLGYPLAFSKFYPSTALSILEYPTLLTSQTLGKPTVDSLSRYNPFDLRRLEAYCDNLVDWHLVLDLVPDLALFYFENLEGGCEDDGGKKNQLKESLSLSPLQSAILLALGLQRKSIEVLEKELSVPASQLLAMFGKVIKKFATLIRKECLEALEKQKQKNSADSSMLLKGEQEQVSVGKDALEGNLLVSFPSTNASSGVFSQLQKQYLEDEEGKKGKQHSSGHKNKKSKKK